MRPTMHATPEGQPTPTPARGRKWLWAGVGAAVIVALAGVFYLALSLVQSGAATQSMAQEWIRSYAERGQKIGTDYQAALDQYNAPTLLTPQTLSTQESLADALSRAEQIARVVADIEARHIALLENMPAEVRALDIDPEFKLGMETGINETMKPTLEKVREFYQIERDFFREATGLLTFMQERLSQDRYLVEGEQIIFQDQADVDEYNRRIGLIQQLAGREAQVQGDLRSRSEEHLQRLEAYLNP